MLRAQGLERWSFVRGQIRLKLGNMVVSLNGGPNIDPKIL